mmetsp:Transcript_10651/g.24732  ORF Transcript_10651/g.24732 Transcript_10651/m.24732 type:complete len:448 (+) Transcript_10651:1388-2731(+)
MRLIAQACEVGGLVGRVGGAPVREGLQLQRLVVLVVEALGEGQQVGRHVAQPQRVRRLRVGGGERGGGCERLLRLVVRLHAALGRLAHHGGVLERGVGQHLCDGGLERVEAVRPVGVRHEGEHVGVEVKVGGDQVQLQRQLLRLHLRHHAQLGQLRHLRGPVRALAPAQPEQLLQPLVDLRLDLVLLLLLGEHRRARRLGRRRLVLARLLARELVRLGSRLGRLGRGHGLLLAPRVVLTLLLRVRVILVVHPRVVVLVVRLLERIALEPVEGAEPAEGLQFGLELLGDLANLLAHGVKGLGVGGRHLLLRLLVLELAVRVRLEHQQRAVVELGLALLVHDRSRLAQLLAQRVKVVGDCVPVLDAEVVAHRLDRADHRLPALVTRALHHARALVLRVVRVTLQEGIAPQVRARSRCAPSLALVIGATAERLLLALVRLIRRGPSSEEL